MPFFTPLVPRNSDSQTVHAETAMRVVRRLFEGFAQGFALRLWDERVYRLGNGPARFTLTLRDPALLRDWVMARSPLLLADAYFRGLIDVEGDIYSALAMKQHFQNLALPWGERLALLADAWRLPRRSGPRAGTAGTVGDYGTPSAGGRFSRQHTRQSDRAAVAFHYDVSNAFYALWLDKEQVYSCAYFKDTKDSLDQAQRNKLEHICRKLRLRPGEQFLDIGCGWGALVCWAAKYHGVRAHGITLSKAQFAYAQQRVHAEGLESRVRIELRDYRDLPSNQVYDKVASVGMFEHVGLKNLPQYLATVQRVLRPGGLFLNHGITHDEDGWNPTLESAFINRYVFPDGELDRVSRVQLGMEQAGFEIEDVEALRRHYALTLRHWVKRLESQHEAALHEVNETTYRIWRLYMAACALEFEAGGTGIYQILASRRGAQAELPLTRTDLYEREPVFAKSALLWA